MTTLKGDQIWYRDFGILFGDRLIEFWPTSDQTFAERVNAVVRFILYGTILTYALTRDPRYVFYGAATVLIISFIYENKTRTEAFREGEKAAGVGAQGKAACTRPTKSNPFGNVLLTDYADRPDRPAACTVDEVADETRDAFNHKLFRNLTDVYEKENSQRQFYTMPSTTIPNDVKGFAEFTYGIRSNCKTNPEQCTGYDG